jgi:hypothetical protein
MDCSFSECGWCTKIDMSRCHIDTGERKIRSHSFKVLGLSSLGIAPPIIDIIDKVYDTVSLTRKLSVC